MGPVKIYEILVTPPQSEGGGPFVSCVFSEDQLLKKVDSLERSGYKAELTKGGNIKKNN